VLSKCCWVSTRGRFPRSFSPRFSQEEGSLSVRERPPHAQLSSCDVSEFFKDGVTGGSLCFDASERVFFFFSLGDVLSSSGLPLPTMLVYDRMRF